MIKALKEFNILFFLHKLLQNLVLYENFFSTRYLKVFEFFVCDFSSHWRIFCSFGDFTIEGKGLQILTYARHSLAFCSEGSLACHTYCDTGHPFIMVISEHPWHSHLFLIVWQWSCNCLFLRLRSVVSEIRTPNLARRTLQPTAPTLQYIFEGAQNFMQRFIRATQDWLIEWIVFYAVSAIFKPCNSWNNTRSQHNSFATTISGSKSPKI